MQITFSKNLVDDIDKDIINQFAANIYSTPAVRLPSGWAWARRYPSDKGRLSKLPKVGTIVNIRDRPYLLAGKVSLSNMSNGRWCVFALFKTLPYISFSEGGLENCTTYVNHALEDLQVWADMEKKKKGKL